MAKYHVGCGLLGNIYAGIFAPSQKDGLLVWRDKSDVTSEAIEAVMNHFVAEMECNEEIEIKQAWGVRGEKTLMVTFELVPDQNKRCDESGVSPVAYFNRRAGQEDKNG